MMLARRPGRLPARLAAGTALVAATAVLGACSGGGEPHKSEQSGGGSAAAGRTFPPSSPPKTIPSVRSFDPGRGPGWKPGHGTRVVADPNGPLADEAHTLAGELKTGVGKPPAKKGDVELALNKGQPGGSEAYRLTTGDGRVRITGSADAGVFYGTRTVLQSLHTGGKVPEGTVNDRPDRPQRGFNLDIARKHYTAGWIEDRLRQMADLKLNQLGLHFSDDQGFRIASSSHPEVVSKQHLTKAQLRQILDLASRLHITVVPEIDSPGHLGAVIRAHPSLQLTSASGKATQGSVNIANPQAAKIVDDLLREYAKAFPGPYFHVGADEYLALTASNPEATYPQLASAARQKYGKNARVQDLATGWLNARAALVRKAGKQPRAWNDGFFTGGVVSPDKGIVVEYWTGREAGKRPPASYLKEGRTVVNVNDKYLYYVLGQPGDFRYPTGERIYKEWTPAVLRGTKPVTSEPTGPNRVPGGLFAVWGDIPTAQTQDQVAAGIRVPLAATAQKLWFPGHPPLSWPAFQKLARTVG